MPRSRSLSVLSLMLPAFVMALMASIALIGGKAYAESDYQLAQLGEASAMEAQADDIASGTCGECTWIIDSEGLLTIKPTNGVSGVLGEPKEYEQGDSWLGYPWNQYGYFKARDSSANGAFDEAKVIKAIRVEDGVRTGVSASHLFYGQKLSAIDLSGIDTSSTKNMENMFSHVSFENNVVFDFDTSKATTMKAMFEMTTFYKGATISFDVPLVSDMSSMFFASGGTDSSRDANYAAGGLDLRLDHCSPSTMAHMFQLSYFGTLKLTGMNNGSADCTNMFYHQQYALTSLEVDSTFSFANLNTMPWIQASDSETKDYWSMKAQRWFTAEEVKATRSGIADTYRAEAAAAESDTESESGEERPGDGVVKGTPTPNGGTGGGSSDNKPSPNTANAGGKIASTGDALPLALFTASVFAAATLAILAAVRLRSQMRG